MANFKKTCKSVWKWIWECIKPTIMPLVMYFTCSIAIALFALSIETPHWAQGTTGRYVLCIVGGMVPLAYHGVLSFFFGGSGYDMLVAGNMKRMTNDGDVLMSSHQVEKEYRAWKGFAIGGLAAIITIFVAIFMGINQKWLNELLRRSAESEADPANLWSVVVFFVSLSWGWATLPIIFLNASGIGVSYFLIMLFAVLPVVVSGVPYIIGAYARRKKRLKKLDEEEKAIAEKEARRQQKINYGGLPGTKPNKKK